MASMIFVRNMVKAAYHNLPIWNERVDKMPDDQVYAIYMQIMKRKARRKEGKVKPRKVIRDADKPKKIKDTEIDNNLGMQLCLFESGQSLEFKEGYLNHERTE